jgi:hypothetical protein
MERLVGPEVHPPGMVKLPVEELPAPDPHPNNRAAKITAVIKPLYKEAWLFKWP